jgi:hypothetical protein
MSEILPCQVEVLDGSIVSVDVGKKATGDQLLRDVFSHVGLEENDYFGLQFIDRKEQLRWLDPLKPIRKQLKRGPYNFRLRVRLYPTAPTYLFDESTRYFVSLQIREDLLSKKLLCSDDTKAALYSYLVQGEFGDYDVNEHPPGYLEDFTMLEDEVSLLHRYFITNATCHISFHSLLNSSTRFTYYMYKTKGCSRQNVTRSSSIFPVDWIDTGWTSIT